MFRTILAKTDKSILALRSHIFANIINPSRKDLLGPTERTSTYFNNDSFDEQFFANENIILCDSYKQLQIEKISSQLKPSITKGPLSLSMYRSQVAI